MMKTFNQDDKEILHKLFKQVGEIAISIADLNDSKKAAIEDAIEFLGLDPKEDKGKITEVKQAAALAAKAAVKACDGNTQWVDDYLELQQAAVFMVKGDK